MGRIRARNAPSAAGREMHTHLTAASRSVRQALDVCVHYDRQKRGGPEGPTFTQQRKRLDGALALIEGIGYLDDASAESDKMLEARALCAWLDSRERASGQLGRSRRGSLYQDRLQQALAFLDDIGAPEEVDENPLRDKLRQAKSKKAAQPPLMDPAMPGGS